MDVDGVLTDGSLLFGNSGEEMKAFSILDGLGIKLLRDAGSQYGATNARTTDDDHACLPGLPDDEVDVLFAAVAERACQFVSDSEESDTEFWNKKKPASQT